MDSTGLMYALVIVMGSASLLFSALRTWYMKRIDENIECLVVIARNNAEDSFEVGLPLPLETSIEPTEMPPEPQVIPKPVQVRPKPKPSVIQPEIAQEVEEPEEEQEEVAQEEPQPVVLPKKPSKQNFAQRVKDMNEGKRKARLARELAAKQAEVAKLQEQVK